MVTTHRRRNAVLIVVTAVALGLGAVAALAYCSVFGCTLLSEKYEPYGEDARAARAASTATAADVVDRVGALGTVLADASRDTCRTGQNNWKVKDTYSHQCQVQESRIVVVAADAADVTGALTTVDAAIRALGCSPRPRGGLDRVRDEDWLPANPPVAEHGASALPGASYGCTGSIEVMVEPTGARASAVSLDAIVDGAWWSDEILATDWYGAQDVTALRESGAELALVVTVSDTYYRTRF